MLLENLRTAYDPVMARILELLPSLGTLRRVSFSLSQRSARYDDWLAGRRPNVFDPALGGGGLADIGVYLTHSLVRLFGTPSRVSASFIKVPDGADGAGAALMTYDGMLAELAALRDTGPGRCRPGSSSSWCGSVPSPNWPRPSPTGSATKPRSSVMTRRTPAVVSPRRPVSGC